MQETINKVGRPSDYSEEMLIKARNYLDNLPTDEVVHSIEGLADYLGITRGTIYDWASQEEKKEFSHIVEEVRQRQGKTLINKGLKNEFNSKIAGMMLSKHGYAEKTEQDITSGGKTISGVDISIRKND